MRNKAKAMFIAGAAVGFVAGARAGRRAYDKLMSYGRRVAENPKVQQATNAAAAKTSELTKTAAAKAPEYAKNAVTSAASTVSTQVPKVASAAKHAAADKIPARLRGGHGHDGPATDGAGAGGPDDVSPDGNLVYPADGGPATANGARYTPDTP